MSAIRQSRLLLIALTVVVLPLIVASCASLPRVQGRETNRTSPFSSRMKGEDGTVVEWYGYAEGHQPGEESAFELVMYNGSQDPWQGRYCIQLLDRHSGVATLTQDRFSVQPGESWSRQVPIRFPDDLEEGAYGLALIIPRRLSSVTTIHLGEESATYGGPWPEPACQ